MIMNTKLYVIYIILTYNNLHNFDKIKWLDNLDHPLYMYDCNTNDLLDFNHVHVTGLQV